jgi:hypothetical protein
MPMLSIISPPPHIAAAPPPSPLSLLISFFAAAADAAEIFRELIAFALMFRYFRLRHYADIFTPPFEFRLVDIDIDTFCAAPC